MTDVIVRVPAGYVNCAAQSAQVLDDVGRELELVLAGVLAPASLRAKRSNPAARRQARK
jgi:hypothetical protein